MPLDDVGRLARRPPDSLQTDRRHAGIGGRRRQGLRRPPALERRPGPSRARDRRDDVGPPRRPSAGRRRRYHEAALRRPRRAMRRSAGSRASRPLARGLASAPSAPSFRGSPHRNMAMVGRGSACARGDAARCAAHPAFSMAFSCIEAGSLRLAFEPLRPGALPVQIVLARIVVRSIRLMDRLRPAGRRSDSAPRVPAEAPLRTPTNG